MIKSGKVLHLSVSPPLAAQLLTLFRSRGLVDHTHVPCQRKRRLEPMKATDLALRLDYQLAHILVDEFQDTSQVYRCLKNFAGAGRAQPINPGHPRTLFIVGDAMQSIYGFRYADVGLFLRAREEGIAGVLLNDRSLSRNFRSQAGVIDWVNRQFSSIVPKYGDRRLGIVPMTIAEATRSAGLEQAVEIHNFPDDQVRETNFVYSKICELLSQSSDSTIGVLARTRSSLEPISRMLRDSGMNVSVRISPRSHAERQSWTWCANPLFANQLIPSHWLLYCAVNGGLNAKPRLAHPHTDSILAGRFG